MFLCVVFVCSVARRGGKSAESFAHDAGGRVNVHLVSDRTTATTATLRVTLSDFAGRVLFDKREDVRAAPLSSSVALSLDKSELLKGHDPRAVFLNCELTEKGTTTGGQTAFEAGQASPGNRLFFAPFKDLRLDAPRITTTVRQQGRALLVTLRAETLARAVHLSAGKLEGEFADNFFDLLPGREVTVDFRPRRAASLPELRRRLRVRSLADAFTEK